MPHCPRMTTLLHSLLEVQRALLHTSSINPHEAARHVSGPSWIYTLGHADVTHSLRGLRRAVLHISSIP